MSGFDQWGNNSFTDSKAPPPRRRALPKFPQMTAVDVPEPDIEEDPDFQELLRVYEESDSDVENEKVNDKRRRLKSSYLPTAAVYFSMVIILGFFVIFINHINLRQLEKLKEEYGLDAKKPEPEFWYKNALFYRIYLPSFKDSNADGIGDINGIRQHIDHLHYLHVDAVILSSVHEASMVGLGKDSSDFREINPVYGELSDFDTLLQELHELGIKVVLEFNPNHTGKRHKWFRQSKKGGIDNQFTDYYMWHDGRISDNGTRLPPSNWISRYGGSAWTWDEERQQFYYHYYHSSMPDLNHRNPKVREEMYTMLGFWMEKGVDGILLDGVQVFFEVDELELNEPMSEKDGILPLQYEAVNHVLTEDQPDIHEYMGTWRECVDQYSLKLKKKIPLFVNVKDKSIHDSIKFYFTGSDAPLSYTLTALDRECGGHCVHELIDSWTSHLPQETDSVWMLSIPYTRRGHHLKGARFQDALNMLLLMIPGAAVTYYGEEIGLEEITLTFDESQDIFAKTAGREHYQNYSRDPARGPMHWSSEHHAGFTDGERPWLPVHPSYAQVNIETQQADRLGHSSLQLYARLASLRKQPSFQEGKLQYAIISENIFSFLRYIKDNAPYMVAINVGDSPSTDDYTLMAGVTFGKVVGHARGGLDSPTKIEEASKLNLAKLTLQPGEGVVLLLLIEIEM